MLELQPSSAQAWIAHGPRQLTPAGLWTSGGPRHLNPGYGSKLDLVSSARAMDLRWTSSGPSANLDRVSSYSCGVLMHWQ
jgi:hypothetical protein